MFNIFSPEYLFLSKLHTDSVEDNADTVLSSLFPSEHGLVISVF